VGIDPHTARWVPRLLQNADEQVRLPSRLSLHDLLNLTSFVFLGNSTTSVPAPHRIQWPVSVVAQQVDAPTIDGVFTVNHSTTSAVRLFGHEALKTTQILLTGNPDIHWTISLLLLGFRTAVLLFLLRTFLVPWFLKLMTRHIRIRSISFRSIRGIYFHQGNNTLRVERISWWGGRREGSRRFAITVHGLNWTIENMEPQPPSLNPPRSENKLLRLVLRPIPIFTYLRCSVTSILAYVDPILRPMARQYAVVLLRFVIRWAPTIIQAMSFELKDTTIMFAALPGTKITTEDVTLLASVELIGLEPPGAAVEEGSATDSNAKGMAAWKNRMTDGFKRSLDRAWGSASGNARMEFKVSNIRGEMPLKPRSEYLPHTEVLLFFTNHSSDSIVSFLSLPGILNMVASMEFDPRAGTINTHTLELTVSVSHCAAKVDLLNLLLDKVKPKKVQPSVPPLKPKPSHHIRIDTPLYSSFGFSPSGLSASIQSALPSFASSFFSPSGNPGSALSPATGRLRSPSALRSPASPFFRAFSVSVFSPRCCSIH